MHLRAIVLGATDDDADWPEIELIEPEAREKGNGESVAITLLATELESLLGINLDTANRLFNVASPIVEEYARLGSTIPGAIHERNGHSEC